MRATKKLIVSSVVLLILLHFSYNKVNAQGCLGDDGASGISGGVARLSNGTACVNLDNAPGASSTKGAIQEVTATNVRAGDLVEARINWNDASGFTAWFVLTETGVGTGIYRASSPKHFFPATNTNCEYAPTTELRVTSPGINGGLPVVCSTNFGTPPVYFRWNMEGAAFSPSSAINVTNTTNAAQTTIEVCAGASTIVSFTDRSNLNCNTNPGDVTVAASLNERRRWRQFVYGGTGTNHNITGGVIVGATPVAVGASLNGEIYSNPLASGGPLGPTGGQDLALANAAFATTLPNVINNPPGGPNSVQTLNITVPATAIAGEQFIVTTRYWNPCNRYDLGEAPVEYNQSRILIVAQPTPPTAVNQSVCQGTVPNAFSVTGVPANATVRFYANNAGSPSTTLLGTDNVSPYQLPIANYAATSTDSLETGAPRYYKVWASYVPQVVGPSPACETIKIPVTIIIRPTITNPAAITGPNEVCNDNLTQYDFSEAANSPVMTPNPAWVPNLVGGTTVYTWSWSDNTGISAIAATGATNKNLDDVVFNIAAASFGAGASLTRTLNVNSRYNVGAPPACTTGNTTLGVTVYRQTAGGAVTPTPQTICAGVNTGTLTLAGHRGAITRWERIYTPPAGIPGAPETIVNTTTTYSEVPPYGAGTYEYYAVVRNGVCGIVNSTASVITVNPVPVKPTITQGAGSDGLTICQGQQTVLQSNNPGGLAAIYRWFKDPDTTTPVQATASNTLTLTTLAQSGTYTVVVQGVAPSNCRSLPSDPIVVTIRNLPQVTSVTGGGAACDGNPAPDIIFNFSGGAPYDFTIDVPVGPNIVVTGHATNSYTLSGQTDPGTYQIIALTNGCTATTLGGFATVNSSGGSPAFDSGPTVSPTATCFAGASTTDPVLQFSLTTTVAANDYILTYTIDGLGNRTKNFNVDNTGTPTVLTVPTFSDTELNNAGPHTIRIVSIQSPTLCLGVFNINIPFTVNPLPGAPTSGGNVLACSDVIGAATVSATVPAGNTVDWYDAATGGALLLAGNTTLNPAPANEPGAGAFVNYFAETRNTTTGCISTTRTSVRLTSDNRPSAPNAGTPFAVCAQPTGPHTATLAATAINNGGSGLWTGPAGVTFGTPNSPTSTVSGLAIGPNILTWTARSTNSGSAGACADQPSSVTVTINALPVVTNPTPVLCETVSGTFLALSTDLTTYNNTITGGAADRSVQWVSIADPTDHDVTNGDIISVIVTNTATGCPAPSFPITFSVVSKPTANPRIFEFCEEFPGGSNQVMNIDLTSNSIIDLITGIPGSTGRTVTWLQSDGITPVVGPNSYDMLSGNEILFARVAVTSGTACENVAQINLNIKPRPADPVIQGAANQCVGSVGLYNVTPVAGATYHWDVDDGPGQFAVLAGGGPSEFITVIEFPNAVVADVKLTLEVNGCLSNQVPKTVTVNPTPPPVTITPSASPVCSNQTGVTYTATSLPSTDYTWSIPTVGGATGSSIIGGQGLNQVTVNIGSVSGNIQVVPQTTSGTCPGSPATFFIDVRQRPVMATYPVPAATVCSDSPINVDFAVAGSSVPAPTFRLRNVTVPPGLTPSRSFNEATPILSTEIHNDAFTNTTNVNQDVRYQVYPVSADNCAGAAIDIFVRIRPEPVLAPNLVATVCSGDPNGIVFVVAGGSIAADQFEITGINPDGLSQVLPATTLGIYGPNEISDDVWINTTGVQHTVEYFVRPINSVTGCVGDPAIPVRVIVNPEPQITSPLVATICSGNAPGVTLTSSIPGSTFQWTLKSTTGLITGGGSGTGATITNILVNGGSTAGTATYEIIATAPGALGGCQSVAVDLVVTIDPAPLTTNVNKIECSDAAGGNTFLENLVALQPSINSDGSLTFTWHLSEPGAIAGNNLVPTPTAHALQNGIPVFVRVDNGTCFKVQEVTYTINPSPSTTASIIRPASYNGADVSCATSTNGIIRATVPPPGHGTGPYQYSIDGGITYFTTLDFPGLNPADNPFVVTVRDFKGCLATSNTINLVPPPALNATTAVISNYNGAQIQCNGGTNGSIQVSPTGGTGAYSYSILESASNVTGATTGIFTGLGAGNYTFVVKDANGCTLPSGATATVPLTAPTAVSGIATLNTPVTCNGGTNGSIQVAPSGGTVLTTYTFTLVQAPFTVNTTGAFAGLSAGTYSVSITDANGCPGTSNFISVTQPAALTAFASITSNYNGANIQCPGFNNGIITVTVNGGNGGNTFVLDGNPLNVSGNSSGIYTGLAPGSYTVTVTDGSGVCNRQTLPVSLSDPLPISPTQMISSPISCNGDTDGQIQLSASGGTGTLTFTRITGPGLPDNNTTGTFGGLGQGTYDFTVSDLNTCSAPVQVLLNEPAILNGSAVVVSNYNGSHISCVGSTNGIVQVSATGGTTPYTFTMTFPSAAGPNGTGLFTGLGANNYTFNVTDNHNCPVNPTVTVVAPPPVIITTAQVTSNYNGQDIHCTNAADAQITIVAMGGSPGTPDPYRYALNLTGNTTGQLDGTFDGVAQGSYTLTASDGNNCTATSAVVVVDPYPVITFPFTVSTPHNGREISCKGEDDGQIVSTPTGGAGSWDTFTISPAISSSLNGTFDNLTAGNYIISAQDINDCPASTTTITVHEPDELIASASLNAGLTCFNSTDASITASAVGGTPNFIFSITTETTGFVPSPYLFMNVPANAGYVVTVTDVNGCSDTTTPVAVIPPSQPQITASVTSNLIPAYHGQDITCHGYDDAIVKALHVAGTGTGSLTYFLTGNTSGQFTGTFSQVGPGTASITARDINNCLSNQVDVPVTEPDELFATIASGINHNGFDVPCFNDALGIILVSTVGGTGDRYSTDFKFSLLQSPASGAVITPGAPGDVRFINLRANEYQARVVDINNCPALSNVIELVQPELITIGIDITSNYGVDGTDISCNGASDGQVSVAVTIEGGTGIGGGGAGSGIPDYTYILNDRNGVPLTDGTNPGFTSGIFNGLTNERYTITASDANSCTQRSFPVTLVQPAVLQPGFIGENQNICRDQALPAMTTFEEVSAPFGGNGSYQFQWKSSTSPGGPFTNVPAGGTSADYLETIAPTVTTYYQREVTLGGGAPLPPTCPAKLSNIVSVTVNDIPTATITLSRPDPICEGSSFIVNMNFTAGSLPFNYTYTTLNSEGTAGGESGVGGSSLPIFVTDYDFETTWTLTSLVDRNGCIATTTPIDRTVGIIKFTADFAVLGPNPQCTGELFTFEHRNDNNVTYTFAWPDGTSRVVVGDGAPQPDTVRRSFRAFDPDQIAELPVLLKAEVAGCNPKTSSEIIRLYPAIIPNIVVTESKLCSGSTVLITNNTLGGDIHNWSITRTNDNQTISGPGTTAPDPVTNPYPMTDASALNKAFIINNTTAFNPATYRIDYGISNDPGAGNGNCATSTSVTVDVYTLVNAVIGSPATGTPLIQKWGENDLSREGTMGSDGTGNFMTIEFDNASTPAPPAVGIEYKWTFSNNNANTPPETFISNDDPRAYNYRNPGVGKRAILTVTNVAAIGNVPGGCSDIDQFIFEIEVPDFIAAFTLDPYFICLPDTAGIKTTNLTPPLYNRWTIENESKAGPQIVSNDYEPVFHVTEPGRYRIKLMVRNPDFPDLLQYYKIAEDTVVDVYMSPDASFVASPYPKVFIPDQLIRTDNRSITAFDEIKNEPAPIYYTWDFADDSPILTSSTNPSSSDPNFSPSHKYETENNDGYDIVLTAYNEYTHITCSSTDTLTIIAVAAGTSKVPNAFTPNPGGPSGGVVNEDGTTLNDVFLPITKGVKEFQMQIFDRWGNLVFESRQQNRGWDGYDRNGNLMPAGVYVYKLVLRMANDQRTTQVGDVTLIR